MNLKIANYFGIPLYLNLLVLPFMSFIYITTKDGLGIFAVALFVLSLFFVILHEYGHCFMARRFNWHIHDITITPLGGVARIDFKYYNPKEEIMVAIAGPIVSLGLACMFIFLFIISFYFEKFDLGFMFLVMSISNLIIFAFNSFMFVFPMDGGRVLRACLSYKLGHERATWWAIRIGQVIGVIIGSIALFYGLWMVGIILILMTALSQNELADAKLIASLYRLRINMATNLNKPELEQASISELIASLETLEDNDLRERIQADELLSLLKDVQHIAI